MNNIVVMFRIIKKSKISKARIGIIQTPHGKIETPVFMPDATKGAIKHLSAVDLSNLGLECLVANTLHLFLRPGAEFFKKTGGLRGFMGWNGPILTDSGGYQVFSLIHKNSLSGSIDDKGVVFRSPVDGAKLKMTPQMSIKIQFALGADIMVCFDDCPPNGYSREMIAKSVRRTIEWAKICRREFDRLIKSRAARGKKPLLFAVVQGGGDLQLRKQCAEALAEIGFDGFGFGARHVDENGKFLTETLQCSADQIPENKLRFGLGIGMPDDIVKAVKMGWDMFDCVIPTREGRHGKMFFGKSFLDYYAANICNAKFAKDFSQINASSKIADLRRCSKAYLHYLFKIGEQSALRLASLNNLEFYSNIINEIKNLIRKGEF